ncbi:phytase [Novosphingobium resinovorum]|uniref:3-phytase n=1 Tax=Novosphingobium resinovorum TaxID=158500 RepID=A0A1D8A6A7_9SPHN|nr:MULTISPECIES: phytase [Novosphingobium]AOR77652.1 3-phytase [Novosphingobium resinovorum]MBF7013097.1 phytase [Novosphingobium sp. HR1a]WJM27827.1 phytase [Novosphingobium resinovorum]
MKRNLTSIADVVKLGSGALLPALLLSACATTTIAPGTAAPEAPRPHYPATDIPAEGETAPVGTGNADAADDPAIWRNAANPAASLILGTDKKAGLYVYALDGTVKDFSPAGALNNADLREVRMADGSTRILVGASDRTDRAEPRIALFGLDGATGKLSVLGSGTFLPAGHAPAEAYGFCMGAPLAAGELARAYVVLKDGTVAESRLVEKAGKIAAEHLRDVKFATQSEGCVVDDVTKTLYVAEEDVAIWKVPLGTPTLTASSYARVGETDGLVDDIEGLAIARNAEGRAWLVASSQGDNAYALFDLASGKPAGRFRINGGTLGGTSDTDGIEVVLGDFGPQYPEGLFMAQDGDNAPEAQNFKLLSWRSIRTALGIR